ncbi:MAG TPA: hypothetical protein VGD56_17610, partial [Gemmatirosa sp.]
MIRARLPRPTPRPTRGLRTLSAAAFAAITVAAACGGHQSEPDEAPAPVAAPATRARPGDTLYIVEYTVIAARREQFEQFFSDAYFPAMRQVAKSDTSIARVLRQSRLLAPARASDDGTLSYLLVLDPVVRGETYNISALLRRVYPAAESERLYRQLTESWARPFVA